MKAKVWKGVLLVGIGMVFGYEVYAAFSPASGDTISEIVWARLQHPMFGFIAGVFVGHLFWQARPKPPGIETVLQTLPGRSWTSRELLDVIASEAKLRGEVSELTRRAIVAEAEVERLRFDAEKTHDWNGPALRDAQAQVNELRIAVQRLQVALAKTKAARYP